MDFFFELQKFFPIPCVLARRMVSSRRVDLCGVFDFFCMICHFFLLLRPALKEQCCGT